MKELHNHIFSNTTCISKETMLRYINKQLSKTELHEVEKHMLDCELCSDAYAGMEYAENSSILFAIDNQIDKRVVGGNSKTTLMRNLMLAASVLLIVFGTYSTFNFFNKAVNTEADLAIIEPVEVLNEERVEQDETVFEDLSNSPLESDTDKKKEVEPIDTKERLIADNKYKIEETKIVPVQEKVTDSEVFVEELVVVEGEIQEVEIEEEEPTIESDDFANNDYSIENELLKKEESSKNRSKKKSIASAPAKSSNESLGNSRTRRAQNQNGILIIDSYKVIDYLEEYQRKYDLESAAEHQTKSIPPAFESKADKNFAENKDEGIIVEITYKETLEKAIKLYKNQKYRDAIQEFDMISAKHPEEVNAQFYSGLCFYHLGQNASAIKKFDFVLKNIKTEFNEETQWYKSLTLIKMKDIKKAKKLLKSIVQEDGFYKVKAEEKLSEL